MNALMHIQPRMAWMQCMYSTFSSYVPTSENVFPFYIYLMMRKYTMKTIPLERSILVYNLVSLSKNTCFIQNS